MIVLIMDSKVRSIITGDRYLHLPGSTTSKVRHRIKKELTGFMTSRNHQIVWLVTAGVGPKTRIGSPKSKHSQIDHK